MNKIIFSAAFLTTLFSFSQNTFPLNGYVGIGTGMPSEKLSVDGGNIQMQKANGSEGSFGKIQWQNSLGYSATARAFIDGRRTVNDDGNLDFATAATTEATALVRMTINNLGHVGIGTTNPDSKLTVKGKIHAEEVKVDLAVPADYVFEKYYLGESSLKPDYTFLTLSEVEKFTEENHHLPNVPSAKEIKENGLLIGEMSNVLLQKIEELTLYMIQQNKKIEAQQKVNTIQSKELEILKKENESYIKLSERLSQIENKFK